MELTTPHVVADKLTAYLNHNFDLIDLVGWAEQAVMEGEFSENHEVIRGVVDRLGVADVKTFGLIWEECERFLTRLGYAVCIEVVAE